MNIIKFIARGSKNIESKNYRLFLSANWLFINYRLSRLLDIIDKKRIGNINEKISKY